MGISAGFPQGVEKYVGKCRGMCINAVEILVGLWKSVPVIISSVYGM